MQALIDLAESGRVPDGLVRIGIRGLIAQRARQQSTGDVGERTEAMSKLLAVMDESPIAVSAGAANDQHYAAGTS